MAGRRFLHDVLHQQHGQFETDALFSQWASSYEADMQHSGYVAPRRCAAALSRFAQDKAGLLHDFGCGTGISGMALQAEGFSCLHGSDINPEMLQYAKQKRVYRTLFNTTLEHPFPGHQPPYQFISAVGVISIGHAPPSIVELLLGKLCVDGLLVFTVNDHGLNNEAFRQELNRSIESEHVELLFCEDGPHLPQIGLGARVFVLRKKSTVVLSIPSDHRITTFA